MNGRNFSRSPMLLALDAINITWIGRICYLQIADHANSGIVDPFLLALVAASIACHVMRWLFLLRRDRSSTYATAADLKRALSGLAAELFGAVPYLIKPVPGDDVLARRAKDLIAGSPGGVVVNHDIDLFRLLVRTPGFQLVHLIVLFFTAFLLFSGELPSFAQLLNDLWFIRAALMVGACGLLIYSAAVLVITLIKGRPQV